MCVKIERIHIEGCKGLVELPSFFQTLHKLTWLNGIKNLSNIIWKLYSLTFLKLSGTCTEALPSSVECLSGLEILVLEACTRFTSLPTSICKLKSLQNIFLNGSSSFGNFPEILEPMERLEHLLLRITRNQI